MNTENAADITLLKADNTALRAQLAEAKAELANATSFHRVTVDEYVERWAKQVTELRAREAELLDCLKACTCANCQKAYAADWGAQAMICPWDGLDHEERTCPLRPQNFANPDSKWASVRLLSKQNAELSAEARALREALAGMLDVFSTHHEDVSRNTDDGLCSCESHAAIHKARALLGDTK